MATMEYTFDQSKRFWHFYHQVVEKDPPNSVYKICYFLVDTEGKINTGDHVFYTMAPLRDIFPKKDAYFMLWGASDDYVFNPIGDEFEKYRLNFY